MAEQVALVEDSPKNVKTDGEETIPTTSSTSPVKGAPEISEEVPKEATPETRENLETTPAKEASGPVTETKAGEPEIPEIKGLEPTLPPKAPMIEAPPNELLELTASWRDIF